MKYLYLFSIVLIVSSCNRTKYIELNGTAPGISSGAIVIKDAENNSIVSETISDGKFHAKNILQHPGYYTMLITPNLQKDNVKRQYDVYMESGTYNITMDGDKLYLYPTIKSASKIQNQLSDYYTVAAEQTHEADAKVQNLYGLVYDKNSPAAAAGTGDAEAQLTDALATFDKVQAVALGDYVTRHPDNEIAAHLLSLIDYKKDAPSYYGVYKKFSDAQKNTVEGKAEGDDLKDLMKLAPGSPAPKLVGNTPDGKAFDPKSISKKLIIIEFWQADNEAGRDNHKELLNSSFSPLNHKEVGMVSISLDTKPDVWGTAIKADGVTWTQISDMKGTASPNMTNWAVTAIPSYELVDGNWNIIKRDVEFNKLPLEVATYLKTTIGSVRR